MSDVTTSWFNLPFGVRVSNSNPVDGDRYLAADQAARDALVDTARSFNGLTVWQQDNSTLYLLIDDTGVSATSVWVEITRDDSNQGAIGDTAVQFAADAADGSFSDLENMTGSNSKWYHDSATGSVVLTDIPATFLPTTQPSNAFVSTRNYYGMREADDNTPFSFVFAKSRGTGNEIETDDQFGIIHWHAHNASDVARNSIRVIAKAADQTGFNDSFSHKGDLFIQTSDNTATVPTDTYGFLHDGTMQLLKVSTSGGGGGVLVVDGSGNVEVSTKTEDNIGDSGGAITNAFTQLNGQATSGAEDLRIVGGSSKLSVSTSSGGGFKQASLDVVESQINHNNLSGWESRRHVNHDSVEINGTSGLTGGGAINISRNISLDTSNTRNTNHASVSITGGTGLSGGGLITASRTINMDIGGLSTATPNTNDVLAFSVGGGSTHRKTTFANLNWTDSSWIQVGSSDIFYRKDVSGIVYIKKISTNSFTGPSLFTLPSGYRPASSVVSFIDWQSSKPMYLSILNSGSVALLNVTTSLTKGFFVSFSTS